MDWSRKLRTGREMKIQFFSSRVRLRTQWALSSRDFLKIETIINDCPQPTRPLSVNWSPPTQVNSSPESTGLFKERPHDRPIAAPWSPWLTLWPTPWQWQWQFFFVRLIVVSNSQIWEVLSYLTSPCFVREHSARNLKFIKLKCSVKFSESL